MGEIYSLSSRTIIWLGADEMVSVGANLSKYHWTNVPEELTAARPRCSTAFKLLEQLLTNEHLSYATESVLHVLSLVQLTELSWFERMWVVQETLLSQNPYLMIGKATLSWKIASQAMSNNVTHATTCCRFARIPEPYKTYASIIKNGLQQAAQVILSFQRIPLGIRNELLANLWMFRNRLAKLPDDKVCGVLGMIYAKNVVITPEYRKSWILLCTDVIIEVIQVSRNLHALQGVHYYTGYRAASWAIDWSDLGYWGRDRARILTELYKQLYCATAKFPAQVSCNRGSRKLSVAGSLVDHIVYKAKIQITGQASSNGWDVETSQGLQMLLEKLKQHHNGTYITGGSAFSAFWRTLLADCIVPQCEDEDVFYNQQVSEHFKPSIRRTRPSDIFAFLFWKISADSSSRWYSSRYPSPGESHRCNLPAVTDIGVPIARATAGRCMFMTSQGYIGLGPGYMHDGDQVALLLGGTTPFVLESHPPFADSLTGAEKSVYDLLGDCYMHGCMDGELVNDQRTDE